MFGKSSRTDNMLKEFQESIKRTTKKMTAKQELTQWGDTIVNSINSFKYLLLHIACLVFSIELGYLIAFRMLKVKTYLNWSFGAFTVIISTYDLLAVAVFFIFGYFFKHLKESQAPQIITAAIAYTTQIIGTKYFIRGVGLMLNLVTFSLISCYIFEGDNCFFLMVATIFFMDFFVVIVSIQVCGIGQIFLLFTDFVTEKILEIDKHSSLYNGRIRTSLFNFFGIFKKWSM